MSISRIEQVRKCFDDCGYLERSGYDIRLRAETIEEFTRKTHYRHLLDIGCGDGSISLPLMQRCDQMTLVDLSPRMLERAAAHLPCSDSIHMILGDATKLDLESRGYDLILCIGILAHVDSVFDFLKWITGLLDSDGSSIDRQLSSYRSRTGRM